jgi:hypothetical protein
MKFNVPAVRHNFYSSADSVSGSLLYSDVDCIADLSEILDFLSSQSKEFARFLHNVMTNKLVPTTDLSSSRFL